MPKTNDRASRFEQVYGADIAAKRWTPKVRVEFDHGTSEVVIHRQRRYVLREGGNSFFWIPVYDAAVSGLEDAQKFRDAIEAVSDTGVEFAETETKPKDTGLCQKLKQLLWPFS
jgi:hypothetical protein